MKRHYSHQVSFLALISMLMLSAAAVYGAEESIVLTTYYPSPYGVYGEMRLYPKASATCNSQQEGLMYYDNNAGKHVLRVCGGSPLGWQDLGGGFWAASPFNSNNIYNTNSGNVGIGTSNPTGYGPGKSLHLFDSSNTNSGIRMQAGSTDVGIGTAASLNGMILGAVSNGPIQFLTNSSERMRIAATGNVGIGTTNPLYSLDVVSSSSLGAILVREPSANLLNNNARFAALGFGTGIGGNNQAGLVIGIPGKSWDLLADSAQGNSLSVVEYMGGNNWLHRLTVRPGGNVGIGTTSPAEELHVNGNVFVQGNVYKSGNLNVVNSALGMWQATGGLVSGFNDNVAVVMGRVVSGEVGFGAGYPWDMFFALFKGNDNHTYLASWNTRPLHLYTDKSWGVRGAELILQGDYVFIPKGGRLSEITIGAAYPGYSATWPYETIGMHPGENLRINFGSVQKYVFYNNGWAEAAAGGGWNVASDQRFKGNVAELTDVLRALKNIRGVRFDWKRKDFPQKGFPEGRQIGFIAQEVEQEFPELVATNPEGYKSLDYGKLTPVLLQAIKEQQAEMESLKARIDKLEEKQAGLKTPG